MDLSDLDYFLPPAAIAQFPAQKRDESKLLVFNRISESIEHCRFSDLPEILKAESYNFIRNNVSVLKARIFAQRKTGGGVECLLLTPIEANIWRVMLKPGKKLPIGEVFGLENFFKAKVLEKFEDGQAIVDFFENKFASVAELSENVGVVPLPPYIGRNQKSPSYEKSFDNERYETVYADSSKRLAAAAPTAGLHFTDALNQRLIAKNHKFFDLTLYVGIGTFQPIKVDNISDHKMHSESYEIPFETAKILQEKSAKKLMVGTTSLRASEDFCRKNLKLNSAYYGDANLFIYPPQKIISADALITNFHLPHSTLLCLVAAFVEQGKGGGIKKLKEIYAEAIAKDYRFFSYGDAMLIL